MLFSVKPQHWQIFDGKEQWALFRFRCFTAYTDNKNTENKSNSYLCLLPHRILPKLKGIDDNTTWVLAATCCWVADWLLPSFIVCSCTVRVKARQNSSYVTGTWEKIRNYLIDWFYNTTQVVRNVASHVTLAVKNLPFNIGHVIGKGSILGWGRSPGRGWQPIPVFLLGESHGQGSLAGYSP